MKIIRILLLLAVTGASAQDNYNLIVGTYTNTCESNGIYVFNFNAVTGDFKLKSNTDEAVNPSYLTVSTDKKFVYSVNEDGKKSSVTSYKYTADNSKLKQLNKKDAKGADPCYIIDDTKNVITANYSSGSISVFGKNNDGSLTDAKQVVTHNGSSINKDRQQGPHVHMVYFSPDKKYLLATDLGTDKIYVYDYNPDGGDKILTLKTTVATKPGSGPRHLAFSPNGIFFYVLHELNAGLSVYNYNYGDPLLIQEMSISAKEAECFNGAADIHFSRDGRFLYATNRGNVNTISVFKSHANGKLNFVQEMEMQGEGPRNFVIDPKDNFVLVGQQQSNEVHIFKRDKSTGMLTYTNKRIPVCAPACLIFAENKQ